MPDKPTAPCKDCPRRQLHCHSTCTAYKEFRQHMDELHAEKMKYLDEADFMRSVKRKAARINQKLQRDNERRK